MSLVISLGSVNADFTVASPTNPAGPGTILASDLVRRSGGKAANVAVLARRLGADAVLLGCVGDDDLAVQALAGPRAEGVDLSSVRRRPGPTGYASIAVPPDGAKTIMLAPGANDAWGDEADAVAAEVGAAPAGSVLVVDLEVPGEVVDAALRAARERGVTTVVDPAPPARLADPLLPSIDHLTPDHHEAGELTGEDTSSVEGAQRAAAQLRRRGVHTAHVKLASGGCVTATPDGCWLVEAPEVEAVDATGAGDAFAGGLAWGLLEGRSTIDAAVLAVAASTIAVTEHGSQEAYPDRSALLAMAERVVVRDLDG
ncbi:ribokinase [Actinomarinicola tropica]|uniref:Ribokinase n=1 Tax=Actinomarinicola tropica TaxID=2789776 RepID=A0A5Q2RIU5_9ACTN|nr:ribokinase [Actinomarinicola tropica]QGG96699.1 ribokinase [Actinomarinicola tropica]